MPGLASFTWGGALLFFLGRFLWISFGPKGSKSRSGDRVDSSLWLGSALLMVGLELMTILLAWDFHQPELRTPVTELLIASGVFLLHGLWEARLGWGRFLISDFDPETGALAQGDPLKINGELTPRGRQVAIIRFNRHLVLLSTMLLYGALVMVTILGGLISTEALQVTGEKTATALEVPLEEDANTDPGATDPAGDLLGAPGASTAEPMPEHGSEPEEEPVESPSRDGGIGSGALARFLIIGVSNAVLGAIFYTTQGFRRNRETVIQAFDFWHFWASLWYRVSAAGIIAVVVFLFLAYFAKASPSPAGGLPWSIATMPLIGLLIGMRVKQAEQMVQVFSERAIGVFVVILTGEAPLRSHSRTPYPPGSPGPSPGAPANANPDPAPPGQDPSPAPTPTEAPKDIDDKLDPDRPTSDR